MSRDEGSGVIPEAAAAARLEAAPECPFCGGRETGASSAFGSHASLASYWCADCRSPFEALRWKGPAAKPRP